MTFVVGGQGIRGAVEEWKMKNAGCVRGLSKRGSQVRRENCYVLARRE